MGIEIESKVFARTSLLGQYHPVIDVFVDSGYTLTGGGAWINYEEPGNLLVQSSPVQGSDGRWSGWLAQGEDVWQASKGMITTYAIGTKITRDGELVPINQEVFISRSEKVELPTTPDYAGWVGVGGGAKCEQNIFENVLLSESAPFRGTPDPDAINHKISAWYGSKQYCFSPTSNRGPTGGGGICTYLIAIRADGISFNTRVHCAMSEKASRPEVELLVDQGVIVSGGAFIKQLSLGGIDSSGHIINMLTATYPLYDDSSPNRILGWKAVGKDHHYVSPSVVSAYVVSLTAEESK